MAGKNRIATTMSLAGLIFAANFAAAPAQTRSEEPQSMMLAQMMGPGMMMGPGVGGLGMGRMCGPGAAGFAEWRTDRLERDLKLTDAQRPKFEDFKAASTKAAEAMRAACPTDLPNTITGRMDLMEKRAEGMLQAVKTVRPALDAFYATLTDEQKAEINSNRGSRRFWRWRDRW